MSTSTYTITATAVLKDETTGSPISGQTIDFSYGVEGSTSTTPMPSMVTDSQGMAVSKVTVMCESSAVNYVTYASYAGNSTYSSSSSGASNAVTVPTCVIPTIMLSISSTSIVQGNPLSYQITNGTPSSTVKSMEILASNGTVFDITPLPTLDSTGSFKGTVLIGSNVPTGATVLKVTDVDGTTSQQAFTVTAPTTAGIGLAGVGLVGLAVVVGGGLAVAASRRRKRMT